MNDDDVNGSLRRLRREPPPFRPVEVLRVEHSGPRLARVTVGGSALAGFPVPEPAASVRLLVPSPGDGDVVIPTWHGNEFLLPDGSRPAIRTLTPRRFDPDALELDVEIVLHEHGTASEWAANAASGAPAAVSGPGRGYAIDPDAARLVLGGDETAIPAISQLLEVVADDLAVDVLVEVAHPDGRVALPRHPRASVTWLDATPDAPPGDALVAGMRALAVDEDTRVWAAGEAAAMQRIRRHLFEERGLSRAVATVRGYWKHGRSGE